MKRATVADLLIAFVLEQDDAGQLPARATDVKPAAADTAKWELIQSERERKGGERCGRSNTSGCWR
jgi:hypothetical protein